MILIVSVFRVLLGLFLVFIIITAAVELSHDHFKILMFWVLLLNE